MTFVLAILLLAQAPTPRAALDRYCVTCHNQKTKTAALMLDLMDVQKVADAAPTWEKVVQKVRTGAMPPPGAPRPDSGTYSSLAGYLETELDRGAAAHPNPGTPTIHRLNRAEYANAIRDLLDIDTEAIDVTSLLPVDDSGYGFDNIGEVLSVSPALLERYMSAARKLSRLAVGDQSIRPDFVTYDVPRFLLQNDRISELLPFGSRGGIAVRHYFPADAEYTIRIELKADYHGQNILGLREQNQLDLRLDGARIQQFTIGGRGKQTAPNLELRVHVKAGTRVIGVNFISKTRAVEDVLKPRLASAEVESDDEPAIARVTVDGPYNTTGAGDTLSRRKIFICQPSRETEEEACAARILTNVARHAYRRLISDADAARLLEPYKLARRDGSFEASIQMGLQRILVSPEFLFRIERDPAGAVPGMVYRINDFELASRLSFFLWSSIPDDELLALADWGRLRDPAILQQQVKRMLADPRSRALVDNFAGQWLYLRNVRSAAPDLAEYPDFDENLRDALQQETELFFRSMLRENHSVLDLLNADYTFLNERLARHYGIPNVYGSHFRRVTITDENRKGLLGQGSILMVTSYANRTSPTLRGKWLLDNLLGAPPPPPPPNVPSLRDRNEDGKILSMRQQMEQHRANPACATCHKIMDPLGFALENFDAVGHWRETSGPDNTPIDASGVLPDGTTFKGPAELRKILLSKPDQFATTVAQKLLTYAVGRGLEYYDAPTVRKIVREAAISNYRWSDLILAIAESDPFQMRKASEK
jgi:hypothetical protein